MLLQETYTKHQRFRGCDCYRPCGRNWSIFHSHNTSLFKWRNFYKVCLHNLAPHNVERLRALGRNWVNRIPSVEWHRVFQFLVVFKTLKSVLFLGRIKFFIILGLKILYMQERIKLQTNEILSCMDFWLASGLFKEFAKFQDWPLFCRQTSLPCLIIKWELSIRIENGVASEGRSKGCGL